MDDAPAVREKWMLQPEAIDTTRSLNVMRRALFLSSFPIGVLTFAIPIFGPQVLKLNAVRVGELFSVYALMTLIMRPVAGWAMDRYGRRNFFLAGLAVQVMASAFFAIGSSFDWLFWGRVLQGIAAGMIWLSAYAMTADLAARGGRGNMFGAVEEMLARGGLYGVLVAVPFFARFSFNPFSFAFQIDAVGWTAVFVLYAALAVIAFTIAFRYLPETYVRRATQVKGNGSVISMQLIVLAVIVFLTSTALRGLEPILLIYVQDHFTTNLMIIALAYLPSALIFGFLQSRLGKVADRVGRKLPIAVGLVTSGTSSAILPSLPGLVPLLGTWTMVPLVGLWASEAAAFSAATPAEQALVADMSGRDKRGTAFGIYTLALSLGQVVGPLVGTQLYDNVSPSAPFYLNTVVLWLGALLVALLIRDPWRQQPVAASLSAREPPPPQWPASGGQ
ncbi:MAG TPA: MFS transporter [Anaerolineae bacterium]|nr:MFS transporter [Anaerolineae bacterium]